MARAVLGLPTYNSEGFVAEVIESLLALRYDDFAIVAVDDCSSDSTCEITCSYADKDDRLAAERNLTRLGMIGNWNRALARAYELHPGFEYFAFASDNDLRHPGWLAALTEALEAEPSAAIAYSRFGTTGATVAEKSRWLFDTRGVEDPLARQRATTELVRAGPVMYGLHRRATLERAGDVPEVLLSDVLFLSHLALYGTFVQTSEVLWFRGERRTGWSPSRQRRALFANPPPSAFLPVSLQHSLWLIRNMVMGTLRPVGMSRATALFVSVRYLADWHRRHVRRTLAAQAKRRKKRKKVRARRRKRYRQVVAQVVAKARHTPVGRIAARMLRR
jgi:glycosyltransferase involved in cell wall biosynthesis